MVAVAKDLGKLSLAIRSAEGQKEADDSGTMLGCDVSPEIARQSAAAQESAKVQVYSGGKAKEFSVKRDDAGDARAAQGCDAPGQMAAQSDSAMNQ
jgi:pilus assembly protein CpaB